MKTDTIKKAKKLKKADVESDKITSDVKSTRSAPSTMAKDEKKRDKSVEMKNKATQTRPGRFIPDSTPEFVDSPPAIPKTKKRTADVLDDDGDQEMGDVYKSSKTLKAKKVSAPGEGSRSIKRRKQEEKLNWDLKLVRGSHLFQSMLPLYLLTRLRSSTARQHILHSSARR